MRYGTKVGTLALMKLWKNRMKAILVINMPNDIDISKLKIGGDGNIYYM